MSTHVCVEDGNVSAHHGDDMGHACLTCGGDVPCIDVPDICELGEQQRQVRALMASVASLKRLVAMAEDAAQKWSGKYCDMRKLRDRQRADLMAEYRDALREILRTAKLGGTSEAIARAALNAKGTATTTKGRNDMTRKVFMVRDARSAQGALLMCNTIAEAGGELFSVAHVPPYTTALADVPVDMPERWQVWARIPDDKWAAVDEACARLPVTT